MVTFIKAARKIDDTVKSFEIQSIIDYVDNLGFKLDPNYNNDYGIRLLKKCKDGIFKLDCCREFKGAYGINAWLSWSDDLSLIPYRQPFQTHHTHTIVSVYNSAYEIINVGLDVFKEMLRTLDMIDGKCHRRDFNMYRDNWYNAAMLNAL